MDSSPAPSSPPLKYGVFLSFTAEDTLFFARHLVSGLLKKQLEIFFDINNLIEMEEKDHTIAPEGARLAAIDQSLVSIVILSEKYASSTWCLTELSRILEGRRNYGQRVIPVFYKVDPSHVRYQIGRFGDAFHKHEDDLMKVLDLKKVKSDLEEISNISGYESRFTGSGDSEVVNDVVNKILRWRAEKDGVEIVLASVVEKPVKSMIQGMAKLDYQPISALPRLRFYTEGNLRSRRVPPSFFDSMCAPQSLTSIKHLPGISFSGARDLKYLPDLALRETSFKCLPDLAPDLKYLPESLLYLRRVRPSFFDSMCALQSLALSGTSIKYLPESVFGLPYLRVFFAEDCQLCELPENPTSPLLEFLFLRRNWALRKIPPTFFDGMQAVKCLDLSMTGIKSLPVSSLSLPTLEWLWLRHCELRKLPEIPNWPVLEGLYLDGNHDLRTIPPSFFDCMPSLQLLDLSMTGIKSLPNSPFGLPKLRSLFLIDCQLCKLPENLMCPELQELSLRGNRQLRRIPPSFFKNMPALLHLCLSKTPIKCLDSLFCLKQLEVLHLRDCDLLMTLSPRIGELKCLKDLDLEGTEIMHLPGEVKELKHLKALKVSFCELPSYIREKHSEQVIYPGTLSSLSELKVLYIDVSPDDKRWNQYVEAIVSELSKLFSLKDLRLYVARTEFLSCFEWEQFVYFDLKVGHHAKRLMPRLPSDAEIELQKYGRRLTYVNGEGDSKEINLLLECTEALFLDRHATIYALSQFEGFNQSLICCVAGECNQLQVLFHGDQMTPVLLEYLHIYYMKSLKSIWEGAIIPDALSHLKSLTLRTCPELTTVFTPALIVGLESLEELTMVDCPVVTNLVSTNDFKHITFLNELSIPTLKRISLHDLPELTAIFDLSLSPNLSWISIYHCPKLKSLPIDKVKNVDLKKIEGEMNWWKALEWGKIHQLHPWRDVFKEIVDCPAVTNLVSTDGFKHVTFLNEPFVSRLKRISLHDLPKLTTLEGRKIYQQHPSTTLEGGGDTSTASINSLDLGRTLVRAKLTHSMATIGDEANFAIIDKIILARAKLVEKVAQAKSPEQANLGRAKFAEEMVVELAEEMAQAKPTWFKLAEEMAEEMVASFKQAEMTRAYLVKAKMTRANLAEVKLARAKFAEEMAQAKSPEQAKLTEAKLALAEAEFALAEAELALSEAVLTGTSFFVKPIARAELALAVLTRAKFAEMAQAKSPEQAKMTRAKLALAEKRAVAKFDEEMALAKLAKEMEPKSPAKLAQEVAQAKTKLARAKLAEKVAQAEAKLAERLAQAEEMGQAEFAEEVVLAKAKLARAKFDEEMAQAESPEQNKLARAKFAEEMARL